MNASRYRSFMVRVWDPAGDPGGARVDIERIQSGDRVVMRGPDAERLLAMLDPAADDVPMPMPAVGDGDEQPSEGGAT